MRLLHFSLDLRLGVPFIFDLVMQLFDGVSAAQKQHISLLVIHCSLALSGLSASVSRDTASYTWCKCSIRLLMTASAAQVFKGELVVGAATLRLVRLRHSPCECLNGLDSVDLVSLKIV